MNGWLIALGLVLAYFAFLVWVIRTGRMERWNLSLMMGFILMQRTQHGRGIIERLSKPKRFWNAFGDLGTVVTITGMVFFTLLMLLIIPNALRPPPPGMDPFGAREILVIPGVNPFVPLWYGIIALIVTLVVHEGGHGVLARANNLKVKSLGLLWAVIPIGAFVEPDEAELKATSRRRRLRVFAAGAMVNLVVAAVLVATVAVMAGAMAPVEGLGISSVTQGGPAHMAGIEPLDVIVQANASPIVDHASFLAFMDARRPGETVEFHVAGGGVHPVTLASRWDQLPERAAEPTMVDREKVLAFEAPAQRYCQGLYGNPDAGGPATGQACAELLMADAVLGIGPYPAAGVQHSLERPFTDGLLLYFALPLYEVRGDMPILSPLPHFFDAPWGGDLYFVLFNLLFWIFWINLMVGITNILPMLPLDGGHIFRDAMGGLVGKLRPRMDEERRERMVGKTAVTMSFVILGTFVLMVLGPRLALAFG